MKLITNHQVGSDLEFFVQDTQTGEIVSAEGFAKGTKQRPFNFDPTNKFYTSSLDNVLIEGNIPPVSNSREWLAAIRYMEQKLREQLPPTMITAALPAHRMDDKYLQTINARTFGCEPSFLAWRREQKTPPHTTTNLRTAGFHVHVSFDPLRDEEQQVVTGEMLIKAMDLFLSVPALLIEPDNERKQNYGSAGEFRFGKSYTGVEYRALSSYFASSDELVVWVYENTERAIEFVNQHNDFFKPMESTLGIESIINNGEKDEARRLVDMFEIPLL